MNNPLLIGQAIDVTDEVNAASVAHLVGPWRAILADVDGDVYDSVKAALRDLDEDQEVEISVRRGSALPPTEMWGATVPGTYRPGDIAYEIEACLVDPDDESVGAAARFAQAQAMAAGLNAAAQQAESTS